MLLDSCIRCLDSKDVETLISIIYLNHFAAACKARRDVNYKISSSQVSPNLFMEYKPSTPPTGVNLRLTRLNTAKAVDQRSI